MDGAEFSLAVRLEEQLTRRVDDVERGESDEMPQDKREYRELLLRPQLSAISARLDEAGVAASGDVAELFVGPIFYRWLLRSQPFDSEWVSAHVGRVIRGIEP